MERKYDVIIVGSGIGGLMAGCYLAKAGLSVLIYEKHWKPGGYCTSFNRKGFRFDVGLHYLGSIKRGVLRTILEEIELIDTVEFVQFDPTDKIIMPDSVTYIRQDPKNTIEEFMVSFPKEKDNIKQFFNYALQRDFLPVYSKIKRILFRDLLKECFNDYKLQATIMVFVAENLGTSPLQLSALAAMVFIRQHLLDPGYFPKGGMLKFAMALTKKFKEYGGEILLSRGVKNILTDGEAKVRGVLLENGEEKEAGVVISNVDATSTFEDLLDRRNSLESDMVKKMVPSTSYFAVFLGLVLDEIEKKSESCDLWWFDTYDIEKLFVIDKENIINGDIHGLSVYFYSFHDESLKETNNCSLGIFANINYCYETEAFWQEHRDFFASKIVQKTKSLVPLVRTENIKHIENSTPITFKNFTQNRKGAAFGWAATIEQIRSKAMPQASTIKNLYLAGHWSTGGLGQCGVQGVAFSGRKVSEYILRQLGMEWSYKIISV